MEYSLASLTARRWWLLWIAIGLDCVTAYLGLREAPGVWPVVPWLLSLPLAVAAFRDHARIPWDRRDQLIVLVLLALALLSRLLFIERWPSFINPDEPIFGLLAVDLFDGKSSAFIRGWLGEPYVSLVPFAVGLRFLGQNISALRVPDGIIGAFAIPALYVVGKQAFGRLAGFLSALFLLMNVATFHLSRTGLSNIQALTLMVVGAGALLAVLDNSDRQRQWAVFGLTVGLTLCVFSAALVWPIVAVVAALPLVPRLIRDRPLLARSAAPFLVCALIAATPILVYVLRKPGDLSGHAASMAVWNQDVIDHEIYSYHLQKGDLNGVWRIQIERTLGALTTVGDTQTDYGSERGLLDPVAAIFFFLGLAVLLFHWRRPTTLLLVWWIVATLLLGSAIIEDPPQTTKILVLVPAACLIAAVGLERVLSVVAVAAPRRWSKQIVLVGGITCILIGAVIGFSYYFGRYQLVPSQQTTLLARYARAIDRSRPLYLVNLGIPPKNEMFRYLAPRTRIFTWDTTKPAPVFSTSVPISFAMPYDGENEEKAMSLVRERFPTGVQRILYDSNGRPILRVWEVPASPSDARSIVRPVGRIAGVGRVL